MEVVSILRMLTDLARHAAPTADCCHQVAAGVALYVVPGPRLLPQQQDGDAGREAAEESVEDAGLVEVLGILVVETAPTEGATAANLHVSAAVTQALLPVIGGHPALFCISAMTSQSEN